MPSAGNEYPVDLHAADLHVWKPLGPSGVAALWVGFGSMIIFSAYFIHAVYSSDSASSRLYHFLTSLIVLVCCFSYLIMAVGVDPSEPFGPEFEFKWVHYADWVIATPMLLVDLAMLAGMNVAEVFFLCVVDMLMIGSGYAAEIATADGPLWALYTFSCICFLIIMYNLLTHLAIITAIKAGSPESSAFKFLSMWTVSLWSCYPLLFALYKLGLLTHEQEAIIYCVLDILAKGVFGAVLVGSREALEGHWTPLALFALAMIGVTPELRRRNSIHRSYSEDARNNALKHVPASRRTSIVGLVSDTDTHNTSSARAPLQAPSLSSPRRSSISFNNEDTDLGLLPPLRSKRGPVVAFSAAGTGVASTASSDPATAALLSLIASNPAFAAQMSAALSAGVPAPAAAASPLSPNSSRRLSMPMASVYGSVFTGQ